MSHYQNNDSLQTLIAKANSIEKQISEVNKSIFEAQIVKIRSLFSQESNFLISFQRKLVESNADKSIKWHLHRLFELKKEKRLLQQKIDKLTGKLWPKRLVGLIKWLFYITAFLFSLSILIMGFFAAIYLLPIILIFILVLLIFQTMRNKFY